MINLMQGDCLELMKTIPDGSVDLILTDPPYGMINGLNGVSWDNVIDLNRMWFEVNRVLRLNGKCILFSQNNFTYELLKTSLPNISCLYRAVWKKDTFGNAMMCKNALVSEFEDICIFHKKYILEKGFNQENPAFKYLLSEKINSKISTKEFNLMYSRFKNKQINPHRSILARSWETSQFMMPLKDIYENVLQPTGFFQKPYEDLKSENDDFISKTKSIFNLWGGKKYKSNVFEYKKDYDGFHPTQKPVLLLEDLIKTYSNTGNTVLDFTMGSGSTGVACVNTNRNFIGIELDEKYFEIAQSRILQSNA